MFGRFIYLFIGVGAVLFVVSCFGCIGAKTRNGCCLICVSLSNVLCYIEKYFIVTQVSTTIQNMSKVPLSLSLYMWSFGCIYIYIYTCINLKGIMIIFLKWTKYSILVALLILVELGCAAFLFFDKSWKQVSKILHGNLWSEIEEGICVILQFLFSRKFQQIKLEILIWYMGFWERIGILWDGLLLGLSSLR